MEVSSSTGARAAEPVRPGPAKSADATDRGRIADRAAQAADQPLRVSAEVLQDIAARARAVLRPVNLDIEFSVDKDSGNTIIRIMDLETETVIRQIPSEEMMALSRALDKMQGALLQNKA